MKKVPDFRFQQFCAEKGFFFRLRIAGRGVSGPSTAGSLTLVNDGLELEGSGDRGCHRPLLLARAENGKIHFPSSPPHPCNTQLSPFIIALRHCPFVNFSFSSQPTPSARFGGGTLPVSCVLVSLHRRDLKTGTG